MCASHPLPTAPVPQFNVCANSSLHDYAKIFPTNNHTVDVDIYQGVRARQDPAGLLSKPKSGAGPAPGGGACARRRGLRQEEQGRGSDYVPLSRA